MKKCWKRCILDPNAIESHTLTLKAAAIWFYHLVIFVSVATVTFASFHYPKWLPTELMIFLKNEDTSGVVWFSLNLSSYFNRTLISSLIKYGRLPLLNIGAELNHLPFFRCVFLLSLLLLSCNKCLFRDKSFLVRSRRVSHCSCPAATCGSQSFVFVVKCYLLSVHQSSLLVL